MKPKIDYTLYLVTDRGLMSSDTIEQSVEQAIQGGCTLVQLREKKASSRDFHEIAQKVRKITSERNVPLIINDRVDIALAVDADGVHVGQSDLPADVVRRIIGPDRIVGVSAGNLSEALAAKKAGADYLGVGAMFATGTKSDAKITSMEELRRIRKAVSLPIVVIGGINRETVSCFQGMDIDGLAVVSAIVAQADVAGAARRLKTLFLEGKGKK
ncbi:thiamine phosphate synthase [Eubacteriales bacterium mix99]|jgi:thiamine-phosphate pyrophosphorylase